MDAVLVPEIVQGMRICRVPVQHELGERRPAPLLRRRRHRTRIPRDDHEAAAGKDTAQPPDLGEVRRRLLQQHRGCTDNETAPVGEDPLTAVGMIPQPLEFLHHRTREGKPPRPAEGPGRRVYGLQVLAFAHGPVCAQAREPVARNQQPLQGSGAAAMQPADEDETLDHRIVGVGYALQPGQRRTGNGLSARDQRAHHSSHNLHAAIRRHSRIRPGHAVTAVRRETVPHRPVSGKDADHSHGAGGTPRRPVPARPVPAGGSPDLVRDALRTGSGVLKIPLPNIDPPATVVRQIGFREKRWREYRAGLHGCRGVLEGPGSPGKERRYSRGPARVRHDDVRGPRHPGGHARALRPRSRLAPPRPACPCAWPESPGFPGVGRRAAVPRGRFFATLRPLAGERRTESETRGRPGAWSDPRGGSVQPVEFPRAL